MTLTARRYRIEQDAESAVMTEGFGIPSARQLSELMQEIQRLREELRPAQTVTIDIVDAYRREIAEVMQLKTELEDIRSAIDQTKAEIATLQVGRPAQVGFNQISGEIGAIVQQTEIAANNILNAAERIELEMNAMMTKMADGKKAEPHVAAIMLEVGTLYEACNFQDLTGQRLSRVMETFSFVEQRVERMMTIWGGLAAIDKFLAAEANAKREAELAIGDQALANGPQVAGEAGHVNQLEIDALFG